MELNEIIENYDNVLLFLPRRTKRKLCILKKIMGILE
jgi:hypothetical protein